MGLFFSTDNLLSCHKDDTIWLALLFLLPYYKFLCKQPWQLYESDDSETLRLLREFPIGYEENRTQAGGEKKEPSHGKGGE